MDISVIIPTYNSAHFIEDCIRSIDHYSDVKLEIIVVDDGSADNTIEVLRKFPRVTIYEEEHRGACAARNHGIKLAKGRYIKFLDSDDMLVSGSLKAQLVAANSLHTHQITFGNHMTITEQGDIDDQSLWSGESVCGVTEMIHKNIYTACPLYPRGVIEKVGGFDERLQAKQETNLNLRIALAGFVFVYDGVDVYKRRIHRGDNRISCRRRDRKTEFYYYKTCYEPALSLNDEAVRFALSSKFWEHGRQRALKNCPSAADYSDLAAEILGERIWIEHRGVVKNFLDRWIDCYWYEKRLADFKKIIKFFLG